MAYLLEGELIITPKGGEPVHLKSGDIFFSTKGTETRWTVLKSIRKVFFLRSPEAVG